MSLFARQQLGKNGLTHGAALMQFDAAEEPQKATLQHAIALRLEVGVHHAYAPVVRKILQHRALGALPPCQMRIVEHDHAALRRWALALANAKSGDAAMIAGYCGKGAALDEAIGKFAISYARQTEQDHEVLAKAKRIGRIKVAIG
jgi:Uncharacterized protein conserved in bacteria (DUF2252)